MLRTEVTVVVSDCIWLFWPAYREITPTGITGKSECSGDDRRQTVVACAPVAEV